MLDALANIIYLQVNVQKPYTVLFFVQVQVEGIAPQAYAHTL